MGYTFNCDGCGGRYDRAPAFMGEFRETFLKTTPTPLAEVYDIGETVTICAECMEGIVL